MNQNERRLWLINELMKEDDYYRNYDIPSDEKGQKDFLRALMNVREPKDISEEFLEIQDEYLGEDNATHGYVSIDELKPVESNPNLYIWQGDITRLKVDAIVNAANSQLCGCFQPLHNCIDNIIHSKSGMQLRQKCFQIMQKQGHPEPTGQAKITLAYNLPCEYILHTVGPIVDGPLTEEHEELLASCYKSCLDLAEENGVKSIALCCISTGVFMFPNQRAAEIAVETVRNWLDETGSQMKVVFNVYKDIDLKIYEKLLNG
ncbi:MAG: protein-ADP-ribose hydrolase [Pseudobutyrivibrio sp.]|uniref:protein-ADP-ribose hydrolase n=1 Tax=Pseudobutyrivibrio sp. TaxID=2014367 RepID=UPI0025FBEAB2|nr:protein-ADP-ribose hydrolase [Pseudobutyrivibrio sp.]MBQ8490076.1 protein-ADP-ribose hydrolase [Pseudobutyrivibrio sp.]